MAVDEQGVFWWHSIRLPDGTVTPGGKTEELLEREWETLDLPALTGKTVLDIGAWDGWFSFRAEAEGAARAVALDHFVWSLDPAYFAREWTAGDLLELEAAPDVWRSAELPGKRGFDQAREMLGSGVDEYIGDFMTADLDELGTFDVVLYLGVRYHMTDPFGALRRLRQVTGQLAVIETEAIVLPGLERHPLVEFYAGAELNADASTWWAPTLPALVAMCRAAGF
jgi:tRNA (mo5U34)-methyltransferase